MASTTGDTIVDGHSADLLEQMRRGLERIAHADQAAADRMGRYANLEERLTAIQASVTSPDRSVTVVAGPGGGIQGVRFTEAATRLTPTQLSQVVTATIQQAAAAAAREQAAAVQEFTGDNVRIADRVAKTQETLLGQLASQAVTTATPSMPSAPTAGGRSRPPLPPEDDDEGFGSVLRRS